MIVLIEPISNNIGMYVPAYPLPLLEIASFVKMRDPGIDIRIISIPMDFGLPLNSAGKERIYREVLDELSRMEPDAVGISCTAISQAEETIHLSECIKKQLDSPLVFLGGYLPTLYPEEFFSRTSAVDLIVVGEGEMPTLAICRSLAAGNSPNIHTIPGIVWSRNGRLQRTSRAPRFDLRQKAVLNPALLKNPGAYDILPYAFSRGCPYRCSFCMEDHVRPRRMEVPVEIVKADLGRLMRLGGSRCVLAADALFESFHLLPLFRSMNIQISFETRCDTLTPEIIHEIKNVCGILALGLESASYATLKRMNKVRNRAHYERYTANARAIFSAAADAAVPTMVFMIMGFPGDTVDDLEQSLMFAEALSGRSGAAGHIFKVGECRVYPKTRLHQLAVSLDGTVFDNEGPFGNNVVRQPSAGVSFDRVAAYMKRIFRLSNPSAVLLERLMRVMPFFRLPPAALTDQRVPTTCFKTPDRNIFNAQGESLAAFKEIAPVLIQNYGEQMAGERNHRKLSL